MRTTISRLFTSLTVTAALFVLAACAGLPTAGEVKSGLVLGDSPDDPDILLLASGPVDGAGPERIVEDFIEAAITPTDNWLVAQSFLTAEYREIWRPNAGVLIDEGKESRTFTSSREADAEGEDAEAEGAEGEGADADANAETGKDGDTAEIEVKIEQIAGVDEAGAYSEALGETTLSFVVVKTEGQWRISKAPDGVVIDQTRFPRVFEDYPLQYFDQSWSRLVPDVRWLPRRATIATTVTQSLIEGAPSPWLEPAVQSAFPSDVTLARDAVRLDEDQIAEVALSRSARSLDQTTLARMRTQLQATLKAAGVLVSQVRFNVDGQVLDAGVVKIVDAIADAETIVLKDGTFGSFVGTEIAPIDGISAEIGEIAQTVSAVDVAADQTRAAVQLNDGRVQIVADGDVIELDSRADLVSPSLDPYGYTWTVPSSAPSQVTAWGSDGTSYTVADAWPTAASVSAIRISADGARVAAIETVGGETWVAVAAVIRDDSGAPIALGEPRLLTRLAGSASDLVWLGDDRLGVLIEQDGPKLLTQIVGGTGSIAAAPAEAISLAGARSALNVKVLSATGSLYSQSGSAWRESATGVTLLATSAGR
ncbi:MAG: LpqB family beta-propeller domain-containing protein [Microbacterium sp.]